MAQRLPTVGGDNGNWGQILNDYLSVEHNSDGTLKIRSEGIPATIADGSITASKLSSTVNNYLASAQTAVQSVNGKSGTSVTLTAGDIDDVVAEEDIAINVLRHGVAGDGSTNDLPAIQAVLNSYAGQRAIRFPRGRYRLGSTGSSGANRITIPSGANLACDPGAVFEINAVDSQSGTSIFYASGSDGAKQNLNLDIQSGAQTVTLPTGQGASYASGDLIGLESTAVVTGSGGSTGYAREIRMVTVVSGDTLTLDAPLEYAYATADAAQFWKINPAKDITLSGLNFVTGPGVTPGIDGSYAINIRKSLNCRLENIGIHNMIGGVQLFDAYDTIVEGLLVDRLPRFDDAYGYGIFAAASTTNLIINGLRGRENRHLFTTLANERTGSTFWGGPMHVQINGAIGYGGVDGYSIFDTHEFGRHIHFNDCVAIGGGTAVSGYQLRAQDIQLNNCRASRCGLRGAVMVGTSSNCMVIGGEYAYSGSQGISLNGSYHRVEGVRIHHNGGAGISYNSTSCIDPKIHSCDIYENASYGIQDGGAAGAIRPVVQGCNIPRSAAQTSAILSPSATAIIEGCIFTGYGGSSHGMTGIQAGAKVANILTDGGIVGNMALALGNPSQASPVYDTLVYRGGFDTIRTDSTILATDGKITFGSGATAPLIWSGTGTPEGVVTAPTGSVFLRTDGGAGSSYYVKESGTGNTGWVAK